ncbi:MAG: hypothetical protein DRI34_08875 [Deltaproteobacteria bacterium]|nr:MAG: hypothetical protein DRI34_08875 [Deltaproteobacteria bacterium]
MRHLLPLLACLSLGGLSLTCNRDRTDARPPSHLRAATEVFWALNDAGWVISKEKPHPSRHGCQAAEYLAAREKARFRISVYHCGDAEQAARLASDDHYRHVDELLRNHHEGGILQRGPLLIIVRRETGQADDSRNLLQFLAKL